MNIFGHIIQDDQIIGIGPLMAVGTDNMVERSLHGSAKYFFDIYLKSIVVKIETDFLRLRSVDEEEKSKALKSAGDFKNEYHGIRKIIENKIEASRIRDFTGAM